MLDQISRDQSVVSFPGLGIEDFIVNKIAIKIGTLEIRWYGILIALGMVLAFLYAGYRCKKNNVKFDDMIDLGLCAVVFGVIGARLYYVIMEHESYHSFMDVIAIWNGGLAIYGGIIGGALAVFVAAKIKKMNFPLCADMILPGVMIAQALGRWGNFFNGEAYGAAVAEGSPLYFLRMGLFPNNIEGVSGMAYVHPTFLYESLWNIAGFVLINILWNKGVKKFDGEVGLWYVTWYGFGRMFIEGLRTDSLYVGPIRISQLVGFACFIVGVALVITIRIMIHKKSKASEVIDTKEDIIENTDKEENENG